MWPTIGGRRRPDRSPQAGPMPSASAGDDPASSTLQSGFAGQTLRSFRYRNFRLFFGGQAISQIGNWLTIVALTLLVLHRTGSGVAVGLLAACQFGPTLLLSAWAGLLTDRHDKRTLMAITQVLEMGQSIVLAILAFTHDAPLPAFYVTALAAGCLFALESPVRRSLCNELVPIEDVPNAVTLYSAMNSLARIVGPALAGLLVVAVGYGWCFTIDAFSYLIVLAALRMMRVSELRRAKATPRGAGQIRAGLRYIARVPDLWITDVMLLVVGILSYNFIVVFPLFVEKGLHGGDGSYTLVFSSFSLGGFVGALLLARRRSVTIRTVAAGCACLGAASIVLSAVPNIAVAVAVAITLGASSVAYMSATSAIAQIRSDPNMLGRVLAIQTVLIVGTTPIGSVLMGAISDAVGARAPLLIGGVAALAAAAFGIVAGGRSERRHEREHTETAVAASA